MLVSHSPKQKKKKRTIEKSEIRYRIIVVHVYIKRRSSPTFDTLNSEGPFPEGPLNGPFPNISVAAAQIMSRQRSWVDTWPGQCGFLQSRQLGRFHSRLYTLAKPNYAGNGEGSGSSDSSRQDAATSA